MHGVCKNNMLNGPWFLVDCLFPTPFHSIFSVSSCPLYFHIDLTRDGNFRSQKDGPASERADVELDLSLVLAHVVQGVQYRVPLFSLFL